MKNDETYENFEESTILAPSFSLSVATEEEKLEAAATAADVPHSLALDTAAPPSVPLLLVLLLLLLPVDSMLARSADEAAEVDKDGSISTRLWKQFAWGCENINGGCSSDFMR